MNTTNTDRIIHTTATLIIGALLGATALLVAAKAYYPPIANSIVTVEAVRYAKNPRDPVFQDSPFRSLDACFADSAVENAIATKPI